MQAQQVLHKLMKNTCSNMHKTRRDSLEANVLAALIGRRLTVTDLGRSIQSETSHKHQIKRADRLLSNRHIHTGLVEIYRSLCHRTLSSRTRPVILIDWSDMDEYKQHFVLRAAVALAGRAITVYEEVHTIETKEKRESHRQFLQQFKSLIPTGCKPILVTDAGFRTTWFLEVEALGWDWVGRVRNRHYMRWISGGRWFDAKQCYQWAGSVPRYLGEGVLTIRNQVTCQFVVYKDKLRGRKHKNRLGDVAENAYSRKKATAQREPWLLATSLPASSKLAKQTVSLYRSRMQVEEGFRDLKSHRFGLGLSYHRTGSAVRLQVLLLIANLALIVIWLLGCATMLKQQHYQFQANSVRNKQVLSIVFIGLQMINDRRVQLVVEDIDAAWMKLNDLQYSH